MKARRTEHKKVCIYVYKGSDGLLHIDMRSPDKNLKAMAKIESEMENWGNTWRNNLILLKV